jgi:serine O-acetyltransferase
MLNTLRRDIQAVFDRDPAARSVWEVLFCYPGFHALYFYRVAHWFWTHKFLFLGRLVSQLGRAFTGIEIHPGARIGSGFFVDHGMGVVIGETAEVGENVTLYHGVTLGGTSWKKEKRHPTLGNNVVVGAGAKILGPITVGDNSRIGANSVVVKDVPADSVVVGIPGRVIYLNGERIERVHHGEPDLEHGVLPDAIGDTLKKLGDRLQNLERQVALIQYGGYIDRSHGFRFQEWELEVSI